MNSGQLTYKHLYSKSLVLSLTVHFLLLQMFIFRIPLQAPSYKPDLNFLGGILTKQELNPTAPKEKTSALVESHSFNLPKSFLSASHPLLKKDLNKPNQTLVQEKTFIDKSLFYSQDSIDQEKAQDMNDFKFDLNLPPFKPIKLKTP